MTQDDIIAFTASLPGAVAVTASEATGAPRVAWGDSFFFFFYDPGGDTPADRRMPFATIVTQDYAGFDAASDLNRPGVFRLNIAVGRFVFEQLIGYPPLRVPPSPRALTTPPATGCSPIRSSCGCWQVAARSGQRPISTREITRTLATSRIRGTGPTAEMCAQITPFCAQPASEADRALAEHNGGDARQPEVLA